jgi:hypothetical protein
MHQQSQSSVVEWDGTTLSGWIIVAGAPTKVAADLNAIQLHAPGFNDVLTREVKVHAVEIFERMRPFFLRQHAPTNA